MRQRVGLGALIAALAVAAVVLPALAAHDDRATPGGAASDDASAAGEFDDPGDGDDEQTVTATAIERADALLADRYAFYPHRVVELPWPLSWDEDPLDSANWQFQLHTLRWSTVLGQAWQATGETDYRDRYVMLLYTWLDANPRAAPASPYAWNDHSTAWRAMTLADAVAYLGTPGWLEEALEEHGRTLADPDFYVHAGNHALNQDIGLLRIGCVVGRAEWVELARARMDDLVRRSIDEQGVTDEQAVDYQRYNYNRYRAAVHALRDCGESVPASFDRIELMPDFLAHATLPNGEHVLLGDTEAGPASVIEGTPAEFAATQGASGPHPGAPWAVYEAGFAFGRTGWGEERDFADEVAYSLRFGPARRHHGHRDQTSVTLYGYGDRLVLDRGKYAYTADDLRRYFVNEHAHNLVTIDGRDQRRTETAMSASRRGATRDVSIVRNNAYPGIDTQRRVVFARERGYLLVHDELRAQEPQTFRQLWHLAPDADPVVRGSDVTTRRERGNVAIRQLIGAPQIHTVTGRRDPMQGWQSFTYGELVPAPTVEAVTTGASAEYLTLLMPGAGQPDVEVLDAATTARGFRVLIEQDRSREGVVADGSDARVVPVTTGFLDTYPTVFHGAIETLVGWGVAAGTTAERYEPARRVTRAQMATLLVALAEVLDRPLPESDDATTFDDIGGHVHERSIERVAAAGVARGVGDRRFAPDEAVTRGQMTAFLDRYAAALDAPLEDGSAPAYTDVAGHPHERTIERVSAAGVARGVGDGRFAPARPVTRGQMATFLVELRAAVEE